MYRVLRKPAIFFLDNMPCTHTCMYILYTYRNINVYIHNYTCTDTEADKNTDTDTYTYTYFRVSSHERGTAKKRYRAHTHSHVHIHTLHMLSNPKSRKGHIRIHRYKLAYAYTYKCTYILSSIMHIHIGEYPHTCMRCTNACIREAIKFLGDLVRIFKAFPR